jgi:hypothetical protein
LEHLLDHTPAAGRVGPLRLDDKGVPDVSDHASERSALRRLRHPETLSRPGSDRRAAPYRNRQSIFF